LHPSWAKDVLEIGVDAASDEVVLVGVETNPTVRDWHFLRHCVILLSGPE